MSVISHFSRRRFVTTSLGLASALQLQRAARALGIASETAVCSLTAEQEVGPYYVAGELLRSGIAEGKPGVPLSLRLLLLDARTCKPLANAAVDIWHCDALGIYSGFTKQSMMTGPGGPPPPGFNPQQLRGQPGLPDGMRPQFPEGGPPPPGMGPGGRMGPPQNHPTDKFTFLRGVQVTDSAGVVTFQTVFPGFYMGRTNHIHFKVRLGGQVADKTYEAGHTSHVGQVFFPEELAVTLMEQEPYSKHKIHRTTQSEDGIFEHQHGALSIARVSVSTGKNFADGMHAELIAAVDPTATPAPVERAGGPPRR